MDQGNLETMACCRNGGTETGVASSDYDEIVIPSGGWGRGEIEFLAAEVEERLAVIGWDFLGVFREVESITAPVEAGEVMEFEGGFERGDFNRAPIVPMPFGSLGSESGGGGCAVDADLEFTRSTRSFPFRDPILGANVEMVASGGGEGHFGGGIGDGCAKSVGHQVGRAHGEDELRVNRPISTVFESLGFDEEGVGGM